MTQLACQGVLTCRIGLYDWFCTILHRFDVVETLDVERRFAYILSIDQDIPLSTGRTLCSILLNTRCAGELTSSTCWIVEHEEIRVASQTDRRIRIWATLTVTVSWTQITEIIFCQVVSWPADTTYPYICSWTCQAAGIATCQHATTVTQIDKHMSFRILKLAAWTIWSTIFTVSLARIAITIVQEETWIAYCTQSWICSHAGQTSRSLRTFLALWCSCQEIVVIALSAWSLWCALLTIIRADESARPIVDRLVPCHAHTATARTSISTGQAFGIITEETILILG